MLVPFNKLPSHSRVWIYQSNRPFTADEEKIITSAVADFCTQWSTHGNPLTTSFKVELSYFIILAVDENTAGASGCSIDGSVRILQQLGTQLNIDFLSRSNVAFLIEGDIKLYALHELPTLFKSGTLTPQSITFNNLTPDKLSFEKDWKTVAEKTWLTKYLTKTTLSA